MNSPLFWNSLSSNAAKSLEQLSAIPLKDRPALLQSTKEKLEFSLQENPYQPYAYTTLADVERNLGQASPERQLELWRKSLESGFYEEQLLHWRTRIALMYYKHLTVLDKSLLRKQLKMAWHYQWYVTTLTIQQYGGKNLLIEGLSPSDRDKLNATLEKLHQKG